MRKFKMLVFSDPVKGGERDFNDWYTGKHLADIVAMPGFTAAQRFKLQSVPLGACDTQYLAIYEMETDDPDGVIAHMFSLRDTPAMPMSPAFDMESVKVLVFEVFGRPETRHPPEDSAAPEENIKTTADRIVELGAELEAPGHAALADDSVVKARAVLHQWVDEMKGIVVNPALGRVTVIDKSGSGSSIASSDLAFSMSAAGVTRSG